MSLSFLQSQALQLMNCLLKMLYVMLKSLFASLEHANDSQSLLNLSLEVDMLGIILHWNSAIDAQNNIQVCDC